MSLWTLVVLFSFVICPSDVTPSDLIKAEEKPEPALREPLVYYFGKQKDEEIRKKFVPKLANEELNRKLKEAFLYDLSVLPKVYQKYDDGLNYFNKASLHAVSYNVSMAKHDPVPELYGNANVEYPWGHTAGKIGRAHV